jgi:hypothetical protein
MSAVREDVGVLSPTERELTDSAMRMRSHYNLMVSTATRARDELRAQLSKGLPPMVPVKMYESGPSYDGMVCLQHVAVYRLVNAYAWANRVLWNAAQAVCDCEELPDDGIAEGIVWELTL